MIRKIKFQGRNFLLICDENSTEENADGFIATEAEYKNYLPSYAHLYPDGNIKRRGIIIGNRRDISFL